jgi:RsiW-degrading membrane proteinase PrsW (M82 family)
MPYTQVRTKFICGAERSGTGFLPLPIFAPHTRSMLQRKQTIFLLLAVLCGLLTFFFPVDTYLRGEQGFVFRTSGFFMADGTAVVDAPVRVPFHLVLGLLTVVLVVVVFLYKNRKRQRRLIRVVSVLLLGTSVYMLITDNAIRAYLQQGGRVLSSLGLSAYLPLLMIVFNVLAERGIRQDEALLKSMDRLR